jgi:hypothetical protein
VIRRLVYLCWLCNFALAPSLLTSHASLLAYEGFDYPNGTTIAGQSGGAGWTNAWATGGGTFMGTNTAGSLSYTDASGHSLQTSGGSLVVGNPAGSSGTHATPNRPLNINLSGGAGTTAGPGGTIWISFLYQRLNFDLGTLPYLRQANFGLFQGSSEMASIGGPNTSATVSNVLSVWGTGSATHVVGSPFQAANYPINNGSTYFILVKVVTDNTNTADTAYLWFNWTNLLVEPDISTAAIVENEINLSGVNTLRFQAGNANANGSNAVFQVDELRVGTTFGEVAPSVSASQSPAVTSQPADQTVTTGDPATFNVSATGDAPLRYQWYFNTNTPLAEQTNASLTIASAQTNDAGGYSVVVTNGYGSATSVVATLTVVPPAPPSITVQPLDVAVVAGNPATFLVSATGHAPLHYQWYFNTNTLLVNRTNALLTVAGAQTNDAGGYSVIVTNSYGSATSVVATLTIISLSLESLPAFPGADGAAKYVTGGRGGMVYHVTKLDTNFNDAGAGGLRYGLTDANFPAGLPRTIVFDVAGVFWLGRYGAESNYDNGWNAGQSRYNFSGNTTIAGQTAPGPVIIMGGVTKASKTNTIIRNVMFAPGYGMQGFHEPPTPPTPGDFPDSYVYDALDLSGQNIMMDHLTTVYITDESISCNELANNLTIQNCNISQGQNYPQADAEATNLVYSGHALAHLLQAGSNARVSVLNNLYAHQKGRLPRVGSEVGTGAFNDFRNNVFYNWLGTAGYGVSSQPSFNNFINNFYLVGPGGDDPTGGTNYSIVNRPGGTGIFNGSSTNVTRAYVAGNLEDTNQDGDPNDTSSADGDFFSIAAQSAAYNVNIGVTLNAPAAFTNVLRYAGSRWWERPYVFTLGNTSAIVTNDIAVFLDERLIKETFTGTGKIMAWADDPFDTNSSEGWEWRSLLALRADITTGAAPFNRPAGWDTDGDGMPDVWELEHGLNPNVANNNGDFDNDGYTDLEEYLNDIAAWPAPGDVIFTGATNSRYAAIFNWQVNGQPVNVSGRGLVTTFSLWQPGRYDTAIINNRTVVVDAVGQHAGTLRLRDDAILNITNGWLKVSNTLEIATAGAATLNLSGGRLRVGTLNKGAGAGAFNFTGGTLSADVVGFNLVDQGGVIAPGDSAGQTHVLGSLTLQAGSSLAMELGATNSGQSDLIIVDGNLTLGGTLNVTNLAGFGAGTYTLITYGGALSGLLAMGTTPAGYPCTLNTNTPGQVRLVVGQQPGVEQPVFGGIGFVNGNVIMSGTGPTNGTYYLLAATNVALPLNLWTPLATNTFDAAGKFSVTNALDSNRPQTFFRLSLP